MGWPADSANRLSRCGGGGGGGGVNSRILSEDLSVTRNSACSYGVQ